MTSWLKRGPRWSQTDRIRQGTGPLDNLVVLIASLIILLVIGAGLAFYVYWWERPRTQQPQPAQAFQVQQVAVGAQSGSFAVLPIEPAFQS